MCKMIQFTEAFCFQAVTSINFFDLGLDVRWFWGVVGQLAIGLFLLHKFRFSDILIMFLVF